MRLIFTLSLTFCLTLFGYAGVDTRLILADGLFRRGMTEHAIAEYEAFLKNPGTTSGKEVESAQFNLAECYEHLGQHQPARTLYAEVMKKPRSEYAEAAKLRLAISLLSTQQANEALPYLETLAFNTKTSTKLQEAARYRLALCYEQLNRLKDAESLYKVVIKQAGDYVTDARLSYAALLVKTNRMDEALQLYRTIITTEPDANRKQNAALTAFLAAYQAKAYTEAIRFAQVAGEKGMAEQQLLLAVAWTALYAKLPEEARVWLAADKVRHPKQTPERLLLEGAIASAVGNTLDAIAAYERFLSEFPQHPQVPAIAETMLSLRVKIGDPEAFLEAYGRVATVLSEQAHMALMWHRLETAVQISNAEHIRASATWLIQNARPEQAAEASYRLGMLEYKEKNYLLAGETWLRTAETWPTMPSAGRAAFAAACALRQTEATERAEYALGLALTSNDEAIVQEALLLRAQEALSEQDANGAGGTLDEYLTRFPKGKSFAEVAYLRGLIFFNEQDFHAAIPLFRTALQVDGQNHQTPLGHARKIDATMRQAQALHSLGQDDEAALLLQPLLGMKDAEPLAPSYLRWLAEFRAMRLEWGEATLAARALLNQPNATLADKVLAQTLIGRAAKAQGQTATAISAYETALSLSHEKTAYDTTAAVGLGEVYLSEKTYQKAHEAFTLAIERADMESLEGRTLLAQAYSGLAEACKNLNLNAEALRANMSLIIFFDDKTVVVKAFEEAIRLLEAEGRNREAERLKQELNERYGQKD